MIKIKNHLGTIKISNKYLRDVISETVEECFGVAGMNYYGAVQGAENMILGNKLSNKGVIIRQEDNKIAVDLFAELFRAGHCDNAERGNTFPVVVERICSSGSSHNPIHPFPLQIYRPSVLMSLFCYLQKHSI